MKKQSLFGILTTITLATIMSLGASFKIIQAGIGETKAEGTAYYARDVFQMNRIRYDAGHPHGISTRYQEASFQANIWDMSYGRVILEAASATSYQIGLRYAAGTYPVKIYVNGVSSDYTFPDNGWSNSVYNVDVNLNEGKNVFIVAILNWGVINEIIVPEGVTLIDEDTSSGVYLAGHSDLQNTYLSYTGSGVHDPDAFVYTSELNYDGSSDWRSKAKFDVVATASTKSVDVTYYCKQYTNGTSKLHMSINGEAGFDFTVYEPVEAVYDTITIPTATLTSNGFVSGNNTIEIIKPESNAEKIGLISLSLKDEQTTWSATRIETEAVTVSGGDVVGPEGHLGNGNWSASGYVGGMGPKNSTYLNDASDINADLSNVKYISSSYTAIETGVYDIFIRYAAESDNAAYLRVDQGSWIEVEMPNTTWWDNPRVAHVTANMTAGTKTITLTGVTMNVEKPWANYDFIDVVQKGVLTDYEVAYNYAVYFREQTSAGCTVQNVTLIPWNTLESEYLNIPDGAKDEFVDNANEIIADARARYQVLINKYPTLAADNWLVDGDDIVVFAAPQNLATGRMMIDWMVVMIAIALMALTATFVFVLRKHRTSFY